MKAHPFWLVIGLYDADQDAPTVHYQQWYVACVCMTPEYAIEVRDQLAQQRDRFQVLMEGINHEFGEAFKANNALYGKPLTGQPGQSAYAARAKLYERATEIRATRDRQIAELIKRADLLDRRYPWSGFHGKSYEQKYTVIESSDDPRGLLGILDQNTAELV